jgi:hypothetical protein
MMGYISAEKSARDCQYTAFIAEEKPASRSPQSPNKRARVDVCGTSESFRLVCRSNFLSIQDLGRLLLFTSNTLTRSMYTKKELWTLLLLSRFNLDLKSILSARISAKFLFLSLMEKEYKLQTTPIRNLEYKPSDYQIIVNVFQGRGGRAIASKVVNGNSVPSFFSNGKLELRDLNVRVNVDDSDLGITAHIFRLRDGNTMCLYESNECDMMDCNAFSFFTKNEVVFSDLVYAKALDRYLLDEHNYFNYMDGMKMEANMTTETVSAPHEKVLSYCDCGNQIIFGYKQIKAIEIVAELYQYDDFFSFPENPKTVTFAHYLEAMQGWVKKILV